MKTTRSFLIVMVVVMLAVQSCSGIGAETCTLNLVEQTYLNDTGLDGKATVFAIGKPVDHKFDAVWTEPGAPEEGAAPAPAGKAGFVIKDWSDLSGAQKSIEESAVQKAKRINESFRGLSQFTFAVNYPALPKNVKDIPKECPDGGLVYPVSVVLTSTLGVVQTDVSSVLDTSGNPTLVYFTAAGNGWGITEFNAPYSSLLEVLNGGVRVSGVKVEPVFGSAPVGGITSTNEVGTGVWLLAKDQSAQFEMTTLLERIAAMQPTGKVLKYYYTTVYDQLLQKDTYSGTLVIEDQTTAVATSTAMP